MTRIKVLHYGLSTNMGGIETYLLRIATHINHELFELHFLVFEEGVCFYEELSALGCSFHFITPRRSSIIKNNRELDCLFANNKFDILHCHLNTLSYIAPVRYAKKYGVKCVLHSRSANASNLRVKALHYFNRWALSDDIIKIAVSEEAGRWLFGKGESYKVIPNAVESSKYAFREDKRREYRSELGLNESCLVIGHVGAFLPVKNHGFLLSILEELRNREVDCHLLLIGGGPEMRDIEANSRQRKLRSNISFLGVRGDTCNLYSAMDIFVLPSYFEGFGNVVLEAQASGLPCLISDKVNCKLKLSPMCQFVSLSRGVKEWSNKIAETQRSKPSWREKAVDLVSLSEFSVDYESKRIQDLYINIMAASLQPNRVTSFI